VQKLWIIAAVLFAIAILVTQYVTYAPDIPPPPERCDSDRMGDRDYSIYRGLLEESSSLPRPMNGMVIFIPEAKQVSGSYFSDKNHVIERLSAEIREQGKNVTLSKDAVTNFLRMSTENFPLERERFTDLRIVLTTESELDDAFANKGGWNALAGSAIVGFSRIGFSCDGNQALMRRSYGCGSLCGESSLILLEKRANRWEAVISVLLSIA